MGLQSPRVSELTGQGLNSVMYAQSGNCAGARSPQVAKATIAQIAAILGFMLTLSQTRTARSSGKRGRFRVIRFVVSPVVSPRGVKMGKLLITPEDRNNYSTRLRAVICSLLMTRANSCKSSVLLRKPPFYPLNYGNNDIFDPFDSLLLAQDKFLDFRLPIANSTPRHLRRYRQDSLHRKKTCPRMTLIDANQRRELCANDPNLGGS